MRHNLNQLKVLNALLHTPNLTRVAESLHMTQSAISKTLAQLRDDFQDPLLIRDGQRYLLTPRAEELKQRLPEMMKQLEGLYQPPAFEPARCQRTFVFASSDYVAQYIYPLIAAEVARQAPKVTLKYRLWQREQLHQLAELPVDLVSTILEAEEVPPSLCHWPGGEDGLAVVMRRDHPLATGELTLEGYLASRHLLVSGGGDKDTPVDCYLATLGHQRRIWAEVPFFQAAAGILCHSDALLTTPLHIGVQLAESAPLTVRPLPFTLARQGYRTLWHQRFDLDPAHRWFRELAQPLLEGHLGAYVAKGMSIWNDGNE
ncbi:LysR family transcriptional regulator [Ferrimonas sediminicola]|uniref:LysR family transcriptional regulator n=1 Tax=Ferrimonas sediminicola TaxID=2569538 RepID=A0A4U1BE01_9GAMM|nr:LysR family transcriptional regulator [Ferrimonas sediminicola]TKB48549.1 LysR family transcriptional regulator [Ferrimonas sediminicola]